MARPGIAEAIQATTTTPLLRKFSITLYKLIHRAYVLHPPGGREAVQRTVRMYHPLHPILKNMDFADFGFWRPQSLDSALHIF